MSHTLRITAMARAAAQSVALGSFAILSACAGDSSGLAGSSVPTADNGDVVGGGGRMDEIYRQIYKPGKPNFAGGQ